jgi:hypothetical protein
VKQQGTICMGHIAPYATARQEEAVEVCVRPAPTGPESIVDLASQGSIRLGGLHPGLFSCSPYGSDGGRPKFRGSKSSTKMCAPGPDSRTWDSAKLTPPGNCLTKPPAQNPDTRGSARSQRGCS